MGPEVYSTGAKLMSFLSLRFQKGTFSATEKCEFIWECVKLMFL